MPIHIQRLTRPFPDKTCIDDFSCSIPYGSRIAIVGRNGSGKLSLLSRLKLGLTIGHHEIRHAADVICAHVPQVLGEYEGMSGSERLNAALSLSLLRCLQHWRGTLLMVPQDIELIRQCTDVLWHIEEERVRVLRGDYGNYLREYRARREAIEHGKNHGTWPFLISIMQR